MERVINRLRLSKDPWEAGATAGERWAKQKAEYRELEKLAEAAEKNVGGSDDPSLYSHAFLRAIDLPPQEGPGFWAKVGYPGQGEPHGMFVHGFCRTAQRVFAEVVDKL